MHRRRLAVLLLPALFAGVGCAVTPTITARALTPSPALSKSIIVLAPPGIYRPDDPRQAGSGWNLEMLAQSLLTQVSTQLNEAGNDTSTTLLTRPGSTVAQEVRLRRTSFGVSHALVITAKRGVFAGPIARELDIDATLLDAGTLQPVWEFSYQDKHADGSAVPKATRAVIKALRDSGFVK